MAEYYYERRFGKRQTVKPLTILTEIAENNLKMLEDEKYSDFTCIVQGIFGKRKFKVHKNILAASSPVFDRMFSSQMTESRTNEVKISKTEPEVFEHLLQFIYGGKLPENLADVAIDLFKAAHYYQIERLKDICCVNILENMSVDDAMDVYDFAHVYDMEVMKKESWKFIKR
jgi:hypothetical protein